MAEKRIGYPITESRNAASTNIPTTYAGAGSTLLDISVAEKQWQDAEVGAVSSQTQSLPAGRERKVHIAVVNLTGTDIALSFRPTDSLPAASIPRDDLIIPAGSAETFDEMYMGHLIRVRSTGVAIVAGTVKITVW
jgi:hypothetical protein